MYDKIQYKLKKKKKEKKIWKKKKIIKFPNISLYLFSIMSLR